jgi:hypothetical protein
LRLRGAFDRLSEVPSFAEFKAVFNGSALARNDVAAGDDATAANASAPAAPAGSLASNVESLLPSIAPDMTAMHPAGRARTTPLVPRSEKD